jgi:hypothetical protein
MKYLSQGLMQFQRGAEYLTYFINGNQSNAVGNFCRGHDIASCICYYNILKAIYVPSVT